MEETKEVIKTIKIYWHGIENYFKHRVTDGAFEGYNNKIGLIKRKKHLDSSILNISNWKCCKFVHKSVQYIS